MSRCSADRLAQMEKEDRCMHFLCVCLTSFHGYLGSWKWYHRFQNKEREQHHCWWCQIFQAINTPDRRLQQGEGSALYWYNVKNTFKYNISLKHKAIGMRQSIFSYWEGVLAIWWEVTSLTQYLLSTYLSLMDRMYPITLSNYKLLPLSLSPQVFSFFIWTWPWEGTNRDFFSSQGGPSPCFWDTGESCSERLRNLY